MHGTKMVRDDISQDVLTIRANNTRVQKSVPLLLLARCVAGWNIYRFPYLKKDSKQDTVGHEKKQECRGCIFTICELVAHLSC